jgi:hypothetical protein
VLLERDFSDRNSEWIFRMNSIPAAATATTTIIIIIIQIQSSRCFLISRAERTAQLVKHAIAESSRLVTWS